MRTWLIKVPQDNQRTAAAFEQLLAHLHETLGGGTIAFEIFCSGQSMAFCCSADPQVGRVAVGQLYASVPDCEIIDVDDPLNDATNAASIRGVSVLSARTYLYPIRTYEEFEGDSLSALLSVMSQTKPGESAVFQIVAKPVADTGLRHMRMALRRSLEGLTSRLGLKYWFKRGVRELYERKIRQKCEDHLFHVNLRLLVSGAEAREQDERCAALARALCAFDTLDLNRLGVGGAFSSRSSLGAMEERSLSRPFILSKRELATLFHLPHESEVPNVIHVLSKHAAPPKELPVAGKDVSLFGMTNFREQRTEFGIVRADRRRHLYVLGKSGCGKSKLLELLIKSDFDAGHGVGVLDPHGDLVDNLLKLVPRRRVEDVVLFDPSDLQYPPALNLLESVPPEHRVRVTVGFVEIFKKLFGAAWTPRLEHVLRYTTLALLDSPGTTVLSVLKMLTDKSYRQAIVQNISDDVVRSFWTNEFASWSQRFDAEAITPLLNKVGQFVATNMIRNIVGQAQNLIDFRKLMDDRKILLMKVSKGLLGPDNAALLGAMAVTKLYQAAMSRADVPEERRPDFYFYVDEFHNFMTESFDEILSEARKYRLNLTVANQFLGQLDDKTKRTVFGNVGSIVTFRVGAEDAQSLAQEFTPRFSARDLINLPVRDFCAKMSITGEAKEAFSGRTLDLSIPVDHYSSLCIESSRRRYSRPRPEVEKAIREWEEGRSGSPTMKQTKTVAEPGFEEPLI